MLRQIVQYEHNLEFVAFVLIFCGMDLYSIYKQYKHDKYVARTQMFLFTAQLFLCSAWSYNFVTSHLLTAPTHWF